MALTLANWSTSGQTDGPLYCTGTTDATSAAAQNVYLGFVPSEVWVMNVTDILESRWIKGSTAGYEWHTVGSTGVVTYVTTNGFTELAGTEAVPASTLVAQGTNGSGGPGIKLGTGILVASKSYLFKFVR
jgi:hypothetical protein